jgi:hypothetical protein
LAVGTARQLEDFEGELRVGPPAADVRGIAVEEAPAPDGVTGFYIR